MCPVGDGLWMGPASKDGNHAQKVTGNKRERTGIMPAGLTGAEKKGRDDRP